MGGVKIITTLLLLLAPVAVVATKELPIATVHAFLKEDCPIARYHTKTLSELHEHYAKEGIAFRFDLIEHTPNTVKAHRMLRHASDEGFSDAMAERLFVGYFLEGANIGETDVLVDLAVEVGMDGDAVRTWLDGNELNAEIQAETRFAYENGINGVPCFVFNRRYALAGAQEPEAFFPLFELAENEGEPPVAANLA